MTKIFVFGSNLAGIHGAGAARYAVIHHGAKMGQGIGHQGSSYAIPTKDYNVYDTLPLHIINDYVNDFIDYAKDTEPKYTFKVTAIGCGLAGYKPEDIGPMFKYAPENCLMPPEWKSVPELKDKKFWSYAK